MWWTELVAVEYYYSSRGQSERMKCLPWAADPGSNLSPDVVDAIVTCDGCAIHLSFRLARELQDSAHTLSILDTLSV
jgi:hypothetical protein